MIVVHKLKKLIIIIISLMMMITLIPQPSLASCDTGVGIKNLVDQEFYKPLRQETINGKIVSFISGWNINEEAGSLQKGLIIDDNSTEKAVDLTREFEQCNNGSLTMEFRFKFKDQMDDASWNLRLGDANVFSFKMKNNSFCVSQSGASDIDLIVCALNADYGVKVILDFDKSLADIYINGNIARSNVTFTNKLASVNNFNLNTGKMATGRMYFYNIRIFRGYLINERFLTSFYGIPSSWSSVSNGGVVTVNYLEADQGMDCFSMSINGTNGNPYAKKSFETQSGRLIYDFEMLVPSVASGISAMLKNDDTDVFGLTTQDGQFCYLNSSGTYTPIYNYTPNVWYRIKIDIDLISSNAALYINGKLKAEGIPIVNKYVNSVWFGAVGASVLIDDVLLYEYAPLPSNYVPEPQTVSSSEYLLGMQACSIWTEGSHYGWDPINAVPERKPYLGFYDENSSEAADWEIKFMTEHGMNFEAFTWFRPYVSTSVPIKHSPDVNGALHDAYFNAKYSDKLQFMIMWENSMYNQPNAAEDFEKNIVPYWIEYYFKDPRYLKIDGRPVVSIYLYDTFLSNFGGKAGATAALQTLKNACNAAGVGEPLVYISGSTVIGDTMGAEMKAVGFKGGYKYNYSNQEIDMQKMILEFERQESLVSGFEVVPTMSVGFNSFAWSNTASGVENTPAEYEGLLSWTKTAFSTYSNGLSKKMVIMASWNEFGEGHVIMPKKKHGFGYLDAIRKVFATDAAHIDIIPNDAQKDRFNNLYLYQRIVPKQVFVPTNIPNAPTSYSTIKGWHFTTLFNATEGWMKLQDLSSLTASRSGGGFLNGVVNGSDPSIISLDNLDINISSVDFIKLRMKVNVEPIVEAGSIYYTTTTDTVFDESKVVMFKLGADRGQYKDYYIYMGGKANWTGTLKQLRIDPMTAAVKFDGRDNFSIDSIELINGN